MSLTKSLCLVRDLVLNCWWSQDTRCLRHIGCCYSNEGGGGGITLWELHCHQPLEAGGQTKQGPAVPERCGQTLKAKMQASRPASLWCDPHYPHCTSIAQTIRTSNRIREKEVRDYAILLIASSFNWTPLQIDPPKILPDFHLMLFTQCLDYKVKNVT